jgi:hypothetical protein
MRIHQIQHSPPFVLSVTFATKQDPEKIQQKLAKAMHSFGSCELDSSWSGSGVHILEWQIPTLDTATQALRTLTKAIKADDLSAVIFTTPALQDAKGTPIKSAG